MSWVDWPHVADRRDRKNRQLDDEELDSGDDEGRADRAASEQPVEDEIREQAIEFAEFDRQPGPEPSDGEVHDTKLFCWSVLTPSDVSPQSTEVHGD